MSFDPAKDALLAKEMMKFISSIQKEQPQAAQKIKQSSSSSDQIINNQTIEEDIDCNEKLAAMMVECLSKEEFTKEEEKNIQISQDAEKNFNKQQIDNVISDHSKKKLEQDREEVKKEQNIHSNQAKKKKYKNEITNFNSRGEDKEEENSIRTNQENEIFQRIFNNLLIQSEPNMQKNESENTSNLLSEKNIDNLQVLEKLASILLAQHENEEKNEVEKEESNKPRNYSPDDFKSTSIDIYESLMKNFQNSLIDNKFNNYIFSNSSENEDLANQEKTNKDFERDEKDINEHIISETDTIHETKREYLQTNKWDCQEFRISYSNGDIFEGEIDKNTSFKDGWGAYFYANGDKYEGLFQDDFIHGYGRYWFLGGHEYEGDWKEGQKSGVGQLQFASGDKYSGFFSNDNFHGEGEYFYHNGDRFQGTFRNGKKQGPGKFFRKNGKNFSGNWLEDQLQSC